MKSLTVTFHHTTNYGAVLQTYALQHTVISLGHENLVLETASDQSVKAIKKKRPLKERIRKLYFDYCSFIRRNETARLRQYFSDFHKDHLQLTRAYRNMEELRSDPMLDSLDCLITGSDQVLNLKTTPRFVDARLLLFGPDNCRRYSYAASLEELNYSDEEKEKVKKALDKFDCISIRESSACQYIESFTGIQCTRVVDPVFLLETDEWMKIAKEPRLKGPYILCYQVQSNTRMKEVAYWLKKKTGYPVVSICNGSYRWMKSDYSFHDVSIEEFIGFYAQASYVVSASFHGVAMGIEFGKPVYAMVKHTRANRLRNVMELMGLSDFVINQDEKSILPEYDDEILNNVKEILRHKRMEGLDFVKKMFE